MEAGCRNRRAVAVSLARLARLGMSEKTARRAVQALERAGLVTVDRAPGRGLLVTLADPPATLPNGAAREV
jgi:DNA-binding GntR family transcriptional regulator